jgi:hypothetical protein
LTFVDDLEPAMPRAPASMGEVTVSAALSPAPSARLLTSRTGGRIRRGLSHTIPRQIQKMNPAGLPALRASCCYLSEGPKQKIMEDLHAYGVLFFRDEKSFQDLC